MSKYALAFLTGSLLVLIFPPFKFYSLAWIAFIPLFFALTNVGLSKAFNLGLFCGAVQYIGLLYWIVYATVKYGGLSYLSGIFLLVLLVTYLSLYFALFSLFVQGMDKKSWLFPITASAVWVGLEYVRANFLTGFPWELLGYSQYKWLKFIQIADIGGVYLLSFLLMLANATFFQFIYTPKKGIVGIAFLLLIMGGVLSYGKREINNLSMLMASQPKIKLAVIQGNIDQSQKWKKAFQERTIEIYEGLTKEAAKRRPEIIIWPETAIPFYFQEPSLYQKRILNLIKQIKIPLLLGSPAYKSKEGTVKYFNRAYLVNFEGKIVSYYDKVHLVPFGEYIPCRRLLSFLPNVVNIIGDFSPGTIKLLSGFRYPLGVLICFEGIFPELSRKLVRQGALLLVNITNDAWFGRTSAPYQHLSMLAIRAVENRRGIARSANTGFSAFIKPTGEIINRSSLFTSGYFCEELPILKERTFYTKHGDILAISCLCVIFIECFWKLGGLLWKKLKKV